MFKVDAIILAAGKAKRMGSIKQLLPVGNTTILGKVIEQTIQSKITNTYCILGANESKIEASITKYKITILKNIDFENGLSTSIVTGVKEIVRKLKTDAIIILLADQPNINSSFINQLIKLQQDNPNKVIASQYNKGFGVPACFPKKYFENLLLLTGDEGAKNVLNGSSLPIIGVEENNILLDIDTPEDYKNYLNQQNK